MTPDERNAIIKEIVDQLVPQLAIVARAEIGSFAITEPALREHVVFMVNEVIAEQLIGSKPAAQDANVTATDATTVDASPATNDQGTGDQTVQAE